MRGTGSSSFLRSPSVCTLPETVCSFLLFFFFFALSYPSSLLSLLEPRLPSGGLASSFLTRSPSLFLVLMVKERQKLNSKVNPLRAYVSLSVTLIKDALTTELGGGFSPSNINLCVLVISSSCYPSSTLADGHETSINLKLSIYERGP